ncbi:unnamed protein product [Pedinophyceae sp. YPF-701]|nr:unnamed protein product [Pedinophyceae sp. YPF-701]
MASGADVAQAAATAVRQRRDDEGNRRATAESVQNKEEAFRALEKVLRQLSLENDLLESFLKRVSPSSLDAIMQEMERHSSERRNRSSTMSFAAIAKRGAKGNRTGEYEPLKDEELAEIASQQIESLGKDIEGVKENFAEVREDVQAQLDEVDMRMEELRRETYEFKRDVIVGGEDPRTGRTAAEKVVKYLEEGLRDKDTQMEKLQLRNMMMKASIRKLEQQLQHKQELGELLNAIDFDQLKIENQQFLERIEERNNELLRLKLTTGKTVQVMNGLKAKLSRLTDKVRFLKDDIKDRELQVGKIDSDIKRAQEAVQATERQHRALLAEREDPEAPQVMDYIRVKAQVTEMEKAVSDWQRKCEIAELEAGHTRRTQAATIRRLKTEMPPEALAALAASGTVPRMTGTSSLG